MGRHLPESAQDVEPAREDANRAKPNPLSRPIRLSQPVSHAPSRPRFPKPGFVGRAELIAGFWPVKPSRTPFYLFLFLFTNLTSGPRLSALR